MSSALQILPTFDPAPFERSLREHGYGPLTAAPVTWLQINVGKLCNQACRHCHVDAGPKRTEIMDARTVDRVIELMATAPLQTIDLTGGAPELNPHFRRLVEAASSQGVKVIDRCNLTVLFEPGQEDLVDFLAEHRVEVTASMPCYSRKNVDQQRGNGVFDKSIEGLRRLNAAGFGVEGSGLVLDLVYNPGGAFLPPAQAKLEADYKERLRADFGLEFSSLITITNMPISRFLHDLERDGKREEYEALLLSSFNPGTIDGLMCRHLVSIDWTGRLYDCDFNQMLELPLLDSVGAKTIWDVESLGELNDRPIAVASHCFGCTAGAGSSCGGALA